MNWQVFNPVKLFLWVLFLWIALACRRKESNFDLPSQDREYQAGAYYTDTITVQTSTVYIQDSTVSSNGRLMCGAYNDPDIGGVWLESFTQFRLTTSSKDYSLATANSAVLYLDYGYTYGDTLTDQTFEVYPLTAPLNKDINYYTLSPEAAYDSGNKLGELTFQARPNTSAHLISITLSNTFAQEILNAASNANNSAFLSTMHGLAIVPREKNQGAVLNFNFNSSTRLVVSYTEETEDKEAVFSINGNSARYFISRFDRSATNLNSLQNSYDEVAPAITSDRLYLQSMLGLKIKITFPYMEEFLKRTGSNVLVNKAVLRIPVVDGTTTSFSLPSALVLIRSNSEGKILKEQGAIRFVQNYWADALDVTQNQLVYAEPDKKYYDAQLSGYLLGIQLGKISNRPLFISPLYNSVEVKRAIISAPDLKLRLYYTLIE